MVGLLERGIREGKRGKSPSLTWLQLWMKEAVEDRRREAWAWDKMNEGRME